MRVLLVAMPETVGFLDRGIRVPNLGLASLAGNLPGHEVLTLDLACAPRRARRLLEETLTGFEPDVVGLSAMTFQYPTLLRAAAAVRRLRPRVRIVAGGYHVTSSATDEDGLGAVPAVDVVVRGEGELTFPELLAQLGRRDPDLGGVAGISYPVGDGWHATPDRPPADPAAIAPPDRTRRAQRRFHYMGIPADVAEASRGCPFDCSFCSIQNMYHRVFRRFRVPRVVADLRAARAQGARHVFFADDNLSADHEHLLELCEGIAAADLGDMSFSIQAGAAGLATHPEVVPAMARAGFDFCFVGFESMRPAELRRLTKPATPQINRRAARLLREHGIAIIAGCIFGHPDDDADSIRESVRLIAALRPDALYAQFPTPYPGTRLRRELLAEGLVSNSDGFAAYDGFTCNVRTRHLSHAELERTVRRALLRLAVDPRMALGNRFLRRHGARFARAHLRFLRDELGDRFGGGRRDEWLAP